MRGASTLLFACLALSCGARSPLEVALGDAPTPDGGPTACATARATPCARWSLLASVEASAPSLSLVTQLSVRALAGDCAGAWLLADAVSRNGSVPVSMLLRLDARGRVSRGAQLLNPRRPAATLAVDYLTGRAALLASGLASAEFAFERLDTPGFPNVSLAAIAPTAGFSLAGPTDGQAHPSGFSFLAVEVRALWGLERLRVSDQAAFQDRAVLPVPEDLGLRGNAVYERVPFDDGSGALLWSDTSMNARRVAFLDAAGAPSATATLRPLGVAEQSLGAAATEDGLLDSWAAGGSYHLALATRQGALRRTVDAPRGVYALPRSLVYTRRTAFWPANEGRGSARVVVPFVSLDTGSAGTITVDAPRPLAQWRATVAGDGVLVAWGDDTGALRVAPLVCQP